jgi:hypothetical protein
MSIQKNLAKPELDLPLPEKDLSLTERGLPTKTDLAFQGQALEPQNQKKAFGMKKLFLSSFFFGLIFVVILVLFGASLIHSKYNSKPQNTQVVKTQVKLPTPTPYSTTDWQIYETKDFSFKYPFDKFSLNSTEPNSFILESKPFCTVQPPYDNLGCKLEIQMNITDSQNLSLENWIEATNLFSSYEKNNLKKTNILGLGALTFTSRYTKLHIFKNNNKIYILAFYTINPEDWEANPDTLKHIGEYRDLFETIISTIEFTDANERSNSSDWKEYYIKEVGISFEIPDKNRRIIFAEGETGNLLCHISIINPSVDLNMKPLYKCSYSGDILIGTSSIDYGAGRSYGFLDMQGYLYKNGKYYFKLDNKGVEEIPQENLRVIKNKNSVEVLKIKNEKEPRDPISVLSDIGTDYGLLVNTNNPNYPGIAFQIKPTGINTEEALNRIIDSIKLD